MPAVKYDYNYYNQNERTGKGVAKNAMSVSASSNMSAQKKVSSNTNVKRSSTPNSTKNSTRTATRARVASKMMIKYKTRTHLLSQHMTQMPKTAAIKKNPIVTPRTV